MTAGRVVGQVVDTESAEQFMRQARAWVTEAELGMIAEELREKSRRFRALLHPAGAAGLSDDGLRRLLRSVFATRRHADRILRELGAQRLRAGLVDLLTAGRPAPERFQAFCGAWGNAADGAARDLASECLHYVHPDEYWLWTRWMWDPAAGTGALRLVTMDDCDLHGEGLAETYLRVGKTVAFIRRVGRAAGFERIGRGPFGTDIFLACVYGVYIYTVVRLRITKEFNQAIPALPELARRLLGVYRMEV